MIDVLNVLDKTIANIIDLKEVKRLKELKILMDKDKIIQQKMDDFIAAKTKYNNKELSPKELSIIKERLYKEPLMIEYCKLYNDLYLSILRFNKKISSLINNKNNCHI